jgi:carbohydrate-selective porin OprB
LGVNLEQAISPSTGFFMRAMQADGRTETHAFTEVDGSLSTGLLFKGAGWGRADDAVGVAWMRNTLSIDRQQFLKAGGISYFIGDGQLNYRPEQILETFYSYQLTRGNWLTADFQHIQNPAYNADRGPMKVYAARYHAEF